eukprot:GHVU01097663.1.p4 GENE.GHVU01097663.1~~GHVU01097663.1.p4  ORF type:complete len:109 (-),score=6.13 GHVU01097663.1:278-604(-)
MCAHFSTDAYMCVDVCTYVRMYVYMCVDVRKYVRTYVYMCVDVRTYVRVKPHGESKSITDPSLSVTERRRIVCRRSIAEVTAAASYRRQSGRMKKGRKDGNMKRDTYK